ncbi:hypothetical protein ABZY31_10510 [Streptomyces sp. NPDC006529]|uniref:hypothetical protein n=1 Tax=Streptomyces sp. NPDC006529 TaxID=3157177 RepID=UPI0033A86FED
MGVILTLAGAALCTMPGEQTVLYAAAAVRSPPLLLPGGAPPARADHNLTPM